MAKENSMQRLGWLVTCAVVVLLCVTFVTSSAAQTFTAQASSTSNTTSWWDDPTNWIQQFVPADREFWESSKFWTSNYGPAFRDVVEKPSNMLACSGQFALCFHSGAEPLPCDLSPDGRSANCKCTVFTKTNYVMITGILNYPIYKQTVQKCNADGSACTAIDSAPVCAYLAGGKLIPGADVLSDFDPSTASIIKTIITGGGGGGGQPPVTTCPKAPYAACMTAPCTLNSDGVTANCKCPVFYGRFMLVGNKAQCSLGGNKVSSSDYIPLLDPNPLQ
jgi:hypothetical protein